MARSNNRIRMIDLADAGLPLSLGATCRVEFRPGADRDYGPRVVLVAWDGKRIEDNKHGGGYLSLEDEMVLVSWLLKSIERKLENMEIHLKTEAVK